MGGELKSVGGWVGERESKRWMRERERERERERHTHTHTHTTHTQKQRWEIEATKKAMERTSRYARREC
jgi:hypothetical protein